MKNKVAVFGVFTSLALILSYVELLIPINFGIPGMKLGLANLLVSDPAVQRLSTGCSFTFRNTHFIVGSDFRKYVQYIL